MHLPRLSSIEAEVFAIDPSFFQQVLNNFGTDTSPPGTVRAHIWSPQASGMHALGSVCESVEEVSTSRTHFNLGVGWEVPHMLSPFDPHTANASSSCFHCVATLLLLLLLLISDGIEAFVLPVSALKRPSSRAMVHLSPTDADTAPRCRFLLHQLATVAGGIFLGGVTGNVGGHTEAQASDQVITQSYIEQVRDGRFKPSI